MQVIQTVGRKLVDAVFPPQCPSCMALVETHGYLCPQCWGQIKFIEAPWCACCGVPLEFDSGPDSLCLACMRDPPSFERARAVMLYGDFSRSLILKFKHADRLDPAPAYATWMVRAAGNLVGDADMIAPVPLHWRRLFSRRYNQSAILAKAVAGRVDKRFCPDLLIRTRPTPSQGRLTRNQRGKNVAGAFAFNARWNAMLEGRRVLLIDDVLTTGSTVEHCARTLLRAGASAVDVLTLARVALPGR